MMRKYALQVKISTFILTWSLLNAAIYAQNSSENSSNDAVNGSETKEKEEDFLDLNIEQLRKTTVAPAFDTVVTSVSRKASTVGKSPAAVFVITPEMIRRSGARSIPEVLRMVPGLQVTKIDSNVWAITSRGFNGRFANKLLVQMDGRTLWRTVSSGMHWDIQDTLLEDIERIEVIRGPGATVWGANAVNGVINITTKRAKDTIGVYAQAGGGTEELGFASGRIGGCAANGDVAWRVFGKWFERDQGFRPDIPTVDDWRQGRGGFRIDWTPTCEDLFTIQGDFYRLFDGQFSSSNPVSMAWGGDILSRWTHTIDESSSWSFQFYWDRTDRENQISNERVDTLDVDFQHNFMLNSCHNIVWGAGFRQISDQLSPTAYVPAARKTHLYSAFIQDQMTLIDDKLFFTIGTKLEQNSFTDLEVQPTARMLWAISESKAAWGAVSRAVRTPSRIANDYSVNFGPFSINGSDAVESEELIAYELGYRSQPSEYFSWDVAMFYNVYQGIIGSTSYVSFASYFLNVSDAESYGVELSGTIDVNPCWRLTGYYTYLQIQVFPGPTASSSGASIERASPHSEVMLRSSWDVYDDIEFDIIARYVDALPTYLVPSYISMDVRLAKHFSNGVEVAVVGQNLLDPSHQEFGGGGSTDYTNPQRSVYGSITWRY